MKYKCIKDFWMEDRLRNSKPAFSAGVVYEFYQVEGVDDLRTHNNNQGRIHYMPMSDINEHFELVEGEQEMSSTKTEQEIVVEWLDKLHYVMLNDDHVEDIRPCSDALILSTTLTDIYGIKLIYDFIQMRYNQMTIAEVGRRKKELLDKRAELELQLAQINKELGE